MGIVKRQSFKQVILQIIGIIIGAVSVLFIYPLNTEILGFGRFIWDSGILFSAIVLLGANNGLIRFFPKMKLSDGRNYALPYFSLYLLIGIVLFAGFYFYFGETILLWLNKNNATYLEYNNYLFISVILTAIIIFLNGYCQSLKRIVIPYITSNTLKKVGLPIFILAYVYGYINTQNFANLLIGTLILGIVIQIGYLYLMHPQKVGPIDWQWTRSEWKTISKYAFVSMFGAIGSSFAFKIDSFMISTLVDYNSNGIYAIGFFIANMVYIPYLALAAILSPIISENTTIQNWSKIDEYYKQGGRIMLTLGIPIFLLGYFCIPDLQNLFPSNKDFEVLGIIVLLIGLTKLFDLATSVNSQILVYSDLYVQNLILTIVMGILNIILNYFFILQLGMGIVGVAMASMINIFIFNAVKLLILYRKYKISPFSFQMLGLVLLGGVLFVLLTYFPAITHPYWSILAKGLSVGLIYAVVVKGFNLSPELESYAKELWGKLGMK